MFNLEYLQKPGNWKGTVEKSDIKVKRMKNLKQGRQVEAEEHGEG